MPFSSPINKLKKFRQETKQSSMGSIILSWLKRNYTQTALFQEHNFRYQVFRLQDNLAAAKQKVQTLKLYITAVSTFYSPQNTQCHCDVHYI